MFWKTYFTEKINILRSCANFYLKKLKYRELDYIVRTFGINTLLILFQNDMSFQQQL